MTNIVAMNKMTDCELDNVAGGTVKELEELFAAVSDNAGIGGDLGAVVQAFSRDNFGHGDHNKYITNAAMAPAFEKALKNDLGIDAYISVGWRGTGFRSVPNTYSINGKSISHQEVLQMINAL